MAQCATIELNMIVVKGLIWDDWNKEHIGRHGILPEEVEEACHSTNEVVESYRKRILLIGKTKKGKLLAIVLSPENRSLQQYDEGIYYPITAFIKEVKNEKSKKQ